MRVQHLPGILFLFAIGTLGPGCEPVQSAKESFAAKGAKGNLNLGKVWKVEEGYYDEPHWIGVWTRRGDTNIFDATWRHTLLNEQQKDVIEVELARDGQVVLFRYSIKQRYRGTYSSKPPNRVIGTADWFGPSVMWSATIE